MNSHDWLVAMLIVSVVGGVIAGLERAWAVAAIAAALACLALANL